MKIYLLRHGEAVERYESDRTRPLSDNGIKEIRKIGEFLKKGNVLIDKIYSSPLFRAYQSAMIIGKEINFNDDIVELDLLLPESKPDEVLSYLSQIDYSSVLLVTHQPLIGSLVSILIFGRNYTLRINKSTLVCIEVNKNFDPKNATLQFLVNPEIL
ncbi:MAG: Phosphohistidine phosphatase SixA [Ignavibacteriae bacterium]|nr:MAG: Phosphohistidine phosphatase SixA [Ignavibacteriota bacterium]